MAINLKDIKQNFFIEYSKYWVILIIFIILYLLNSVRKYYYGTDNITGNIDYSLYVTSGVAINNKYVITNKKTIDEACFGRLSGLKGDFYVINSKNIYRAVISNGDDMNNMILLRLKKNQDNLDNYAILDLSQPSYSTNKRFIVPVALNKPGIFNFKLARVVANFDGNFFVAFKSPFKKKDLSGMPVFNKNYVLQGIIRDENYNYNEMTSRDKILNNLNIQKTYLVNGVDTIKNFLNKYNIEYSVIDRNTNLNNEKYNPKLSLVNIICVIKY